MRFEYYSVWSFLVSETSPTRNILLTTENLSRGSWAQEDQLPATLTPPSAPMHRNSTSGILSENQFEIIKTWNNFTHLRREMFPIHTHKTYRWKNVGDQMLVSILSLWVTISPCAHLWNASSGHFLYRTQVPSLSISVTNSLLSQQCRLAHSLTHLVPVTGANSLVMLIKLLRAAPSCVQISSRLEKEKTSGNGFQIHSLWICFPFQKLQRYQFARLLMTGIANTAILFWFGLVWEKNVLFPLTQSCCHALNDVTQVESHNTCQTKPMKPNLTI